MSDQPQQAPQPQVITLTSENALPILLQFVEQAHKLGSFTLAEADILKRCKDVVLQNAQDPEVTFENAKQLIVSAIHKGQSKGSFTLDDASVLFKVTSFVTSNNYQNYRDQSQQQSQESQEEDLSELSAPVPLKKATPKVI